MWTNLLQLGLSDKNGFFLRCSLNCELKMAVFRGKVLAGQFVNAFTWQFIRNTPAGDTGGQKHENILTTAKYLRSYEDNKQYLAINKKMSFGNAGGQKYENILGCIATAKFNTKWIFLNIWQQTKDILEYQATNKEYQGTSKKGSTVHHNSTISKQLGDKKARI